MYAIKAKYDGKNFNPEQPVPVKDDCDVLIIFLEPEKSPKKIPFMELGGIFKDKIRMSGDFNEPLEELREYTE